MNTVNYISQSNKFKSSLTLDLGISYLVGNFRISKKLFYSFCNYVSSIFAIQLNFIEEDSRHGKYLYNKSAISYERDLKIMYKEFSDFSIQSSFVISDEILKAQPLKNILEFIVRASQFYGVSFSRIDLRMDDYKRRVTISELHRLVQDGEVVGVSKYKVTSKRSKSSKVDSIRLISKRRYLEVYNAEFVHDIAAERWKARFIERRVDSIVDYIVEKYDDFENIQDICLIEVLKFIGKKILSVAEFVSLDKNKIKTSKKPKRYKFYQSFYDDLEKFNFSFKK